MAEHQVEKKRSVPALLGRELPSSLEAERATLAAILLNEENLVQVAGSLSGVDFYHRPHQIIYQALIDLSYENKKLDLVVLNEHLTARGQIELCGGLDYLLELQEQLPALGLINQHARIVKEKALLRNLIIVSSEAISSCYEQQGKSVDVILDTAEKKIFQVSKHLSTDSFVPLSELLKVAFKRLSELGERAGTVTGVPTGFSKFDEMTSGMQRGDLLILAARPSMGKTALALNMALNAWHTGAAVGIFSLEMSSEQLVLRMISSESGIQSQRIRNASISSEEWAELTNAAARLSDAKIFIDDSPTLTIIELRAKARRLKARHDIQFLVVDYLQLIAGDSNKYENRTQEISVISRGLKGLAKELDIPVLALSQLSRGLEARLDKRPILSDLRDSGAIEQDGDVICFIYRDVVYHPDTEHPDIAELIIGKQRNGPTGTVQMRFNGAVTRFDDCVD